MDYMQFIKFNLLTGGQEIKLAILVDCDFSSRHCVCLVDISLLLSLLAMISSGQFYYWPSIIMKTRYFSQDSMPLNARAPDN